MKGTERPSLCVGVFKLFPTQVQIAYIAKLAIVKHPGIKVNAPHGIAIRGHIGETT